MKDNEYGNQPFDKIISWKCKKCGGIIHHEPTKLGCPYCGNSEDSILKKLIDGLDKEDFMNKEALEALNWYYKEIEEKYNGKNVMNDEYAIIIEQALTQEVSKDTNVEEVMSALENLIQHCTFEVSDEHAYKVDFNKDFETIRNYITNVPKDVPNQSAKEMFEALGFMCFGYKSNIIKYDKYGVSYVFFKDDNDKHFYTISLSEDNSREYIISMEEHQAITQQLKELQND